MFISIEMKYLFHFDSVHAIEISKGELCVLILSKEELIFVKIICDLILTRHSKNIDFNYNHLINL